MASLEDALLCLASQSVDDFEVLLMAHCSDDVVLEDVRKLVGSFEESFEARVNVTQIPEGNRAAPLNVGLRSGSGEYVAFLDDDDLVAGDWVECFRAEARLNPGRVIRARVLASEVRALKTPDGPPYERTWRLYDRFDKRFNIAAHLHSNRTPICSYAAPMRELSELGIAFDEDLEVVEDWDFLLRAALHISVSDVDRFTSVYNRWVSDSGSKSEVGEEAWRQAERRVIEALDSDRLVLPPGSASQIAAEVGEGVLAKHELKRAGARIADLERGLMECQANLTAFESSTSWKITRPLRALRTLVGRIRHPSR